METEYFKLIGQKTGDKLILIAVVSPDLFGNVPDIFELQAFKTPPTIYTGTYPTIRINTSTIKDITKEKKGNGIAGLITESDWYVKKTKEKDIFGISL